MDTIKELIEKRAYQLFLDRGGQHGYHIEDWLQAETEIMAQLKKKPPKAAVRRGAKTTPSSRRSPKS